MSQPVITSDDGSDVATTVSFNRPGEWGPEMPSEGPALVLPPEYAGLKVCGDIFVEFLKVGGGKNHVVLRVPLEEPVAIQGVAFYAVRLAMDLSPEEFVVLDDSENGAFYDAEKEAGQDYYPGKFSVKFLKYDTASDKNQYTLGFNIIKTDITVGALIDVAKNANIYKFVFLAYAGFTETKVWKGCRDFILQYWLLLVSNGIIEGKTDDDISLIDRIAFVYNRGEGPRPQLVDKGDFVRFDRNETDDHVRAVYQGVV